jgi:hypothetical protein
MQNVFAMAPYSLKRICARAREAGFDEVELRSFNNTLPSVVQSVADYQSQGGPINLHDDGSVRSSSPLGAVDMSVKK